jgi:hypothetical protein
MKDSLKAGITNLFLAVQGILYVVFLYFDLTKQNVSFSNNIKFTIIILCFFYVTIINIGSRKVEKQGICLQAGLLFTVIADLFLLVLDSHYFYGVVFFIIVQQIYAIKLEFAQKQDNYNKRFLLHLALMRLLLQISVAVAVCLIVFCLGMKPDALLAASAFYFASIFYNVLFSVRVSLKNKWNRNYLRFAVGMLLFLLCDINVGIFNLSDFISLPFTQQYSVFYSISSVLMWVFYAPAQILIALSI